MHVIGNNLHALSSISVTMLSLGMVVCFCAFFGSSYFRNCSAANILAVMPVPMYSHQNVFRPLWKELSRRGHHVTLLTTDPINDSSLVNLTEIDWHFAYDLYNVKHKSAEMMRDYQTNLLNVASLYVDMMNDITDQELSHPAVQKLIKDPEAKFDLLILENIYPSMLAFSERFKCPYISVVPLDALGITHEAMGNPTNPGLYPDFLVPFSGSLNFFERLISTVFWLWIRYFFNNTIYPSIDVVVKGHFGDDIPPTHEMYKKASALFFNTNPILHNIRPLVPSAIDLGGGMQIEKIAKPLPIVSFVGVVMWKTLFTFGI